MNKDLSRIVAELFAKPAEGKELDDRVRRLGVEIRNVVQGDETMFGKFRGLLESFREIIPDERQRHHAALKALSTTTKLGRQGIITAMGGQLEELKIIEKSLTPALPGWREELRAMEAKARETRGEIAKLREIITRLEHEEKTLLSGKAAREKEMELVEKAMTKLFAEIGAGMSAVKKKLEEFTAEAPAAQPAPQQDAAKSDVPAGQKAATPPPPAPQNSEWQKKCPNCGGQMNLHAPDRLWVCYTCAYQEPAENELRGREEGKSAPANAPQSVPAPEQAPSSLHVVPLASMTSSEYQNPKKHPGKPTKKKTCPVCHKKMLWYPDIGNWICPHCEYQRRG